MPAVERLELKYTLGTLLILGLHQQHLESNVFMVHCRWLVLSGAFFMVLYEHLTCYQIFLLLGDFNEKHLKILQNPLSLSKPNQRWYRFFLWGTHNFHFAVYDNVVNHTYCVCIWNLKLQPVITFTLLCINNSYQQLSRHCPLVTGNQPQSIAKSYI